MLDKVWLYGAFWGGGIEKSWKNSLVLLLYLYIEAINSQFYEHLLMITAGINDLGVWLLASGKRLRNSVGGLIVDVVKVDLLLVRKISKHHFSRDIEKSFQEVTLIGPEPHHFFSF